MGTDAPPAATASKAMFWSGWVVTALPAFALTMSAFMKLTHSKDLVEGFAKFGFPLELAQPIGIVELICVAVYLIPQTAVLGAILATGYLGGAVVTHVRVQDGMFAPPIIIGVLVWLGLFLRDARVRALIPIRW